MPKQITRKYSSPLREQQAAQTRGKIIAAAEHLLLTCGYAKTTVEDIAAAANVSAQTIYLIFKNKPGIMTAVLEQAFEDTEGQLAATRALEEADIHARIRCTVAFLVQARRKETPRYELLRNAGILSPDLAEIAAAAELSAQKKQAEHTRRIFEGVSLKQGITIERAVDIWWYITHREGYQTLVQKRGWKHKEYEEWLIEMLESATLGK